MKCSLIFGFEHHHYCYHHIITISTITISTITITITIITVTIVTITITTRPKRSYTVAVDSQNMMVV